MWIKVKGKIRMGDSYLLPESRDIPFNIREYHAATRRLREEHFYKYNIKVIWSNKYENLIDRLKNKNNKHVKRSQKSKFTSSGKQK